MNKLMHLQCTVFIKYLLLTLGNIFLDVLYGGNSQMLLNSIDNLKLIYLKMNNKIISLKNLMFLSTSNDKAIGTCV